MDVVRVDANGPVLEILLNRPSGNPIDHAVLDGLQEAIAGVGSATACILLRGAGASFCVGGDVRAFSGAGAPGDGVPGLVRRLHEVTRDLTDLDIPVIVAVQGWAAGAGLSLACCADVVIASKSARFVTAYNALGLTPDGGLTWTLPRTVGRRVAMDLLLSRRALTAQEALAVGLVSRVVADGDLIDCAVDLANEIAALPGIALRETKRLVHSGVTADFDRHLDAEERALTRTARSPSGRAGIGSFLARMAN